MFGNTLAGRYNPVEGARFIVDLTKTRGFSGDEAASIDARLEMQNNAAIWITSDIEDHLTTRILELYKNGLTQREIREKLGIGLGTVNRHLKKAKGGQNSS